MPPAKSRKRKRASPKRRSPVARPRSTKQRAKRSPSRSRAPYAAMAAAFQADLERVVRETAAWSPAPPLVPGVSAIHRESRQAVAAGKRPRLITAKTTRATLLIEWAPTRQGRGSPAFRDRRTGKVRDRLRQLRSVELSRPVPAHEIRDYLLGLGRYAKEGQRVQELLAPELSGKKLKFRDIVAVIPRAQTGATASALRSYFVKRLAPALAAKERIRSRTRARSSRRRSAGSRGSSSKTSRRK